MMIANGRDYPTTLLPGMTVNAPDLAILDTVRGVEAREREIQPLNGVGHCVQQNYLTRIRSIGEDASAA